MTPIAHGNPLNYDYYNPGIFPPRDSKESENASKSKRPKFRMQKPIVPKCIVLIPVYSSPRSENT